MFGKSKQWVVKILEFKTRNCIVTNVYRFIRAIIPYKNSDHSSAHEGVAKSYVVRRQSEEIAKKVMTLEKEMRKRTPHLIVHSQGGRR